MPSKPFVWAISPAFSSKNWVNRSTYSIFAPTAFVLGRFHPAFSNSIPSYNTKRMQRNNIASESIFNRSYN